MAPQDGQSFSTQILSTRSINGDGVHRHIHGGREPDIALVYSKPLRYLATALSSSTAISWSHFPSLSSVSRDYLRYTQSLPPSTFTQILPRLQAQTLAACLIECAPNSCWACAWCPFRPLWLHKYLQIIYFGARKVLQARRSFPRFHLPQASQHPPWWKNVIPFVPTVQPRGIAGPVASVLPQILTTNRQLRAALFT